jgi:hypothetical protein
MRPTVTYAAETWTLMERDMNYLVIFERRIMRRVLVPFKKGTDRGSGLIMN